MTKSKNDEVFPENQIYAETNYKNILITQKLYFIITHLLFLYNVLNTVLKKRHCDSENVGHPLFDNKKWIICM